MRERTRAILWTIVCLFLLMAGEITAFVFAWRTGTGAAIAEIVGFIIGYFFATIVHEIGHILVAKSQKMHIAYAKFSFLKIYEKNGKKRLAFASPFTADETQAIPKTGGNIERRARLYTLGGLMFGAVYLLVFSAIALALFFTVGGWISYGFFGVLPYGAYLFLVNVFPCEYANGKTDMKVYEGIKKGAPAEKTMLSAMEIQGKLYEGNAYAQIDEGLYFDTPQLAEDEPLFVVILHLRYRYYLDKGDMKNAADCLNRLAQASAYLTDAETERIAAELVYMHALNGDKERAEACSKAFATYVQSDVVAAKRVLATVARCFHQEEKASVLKAQAMQCLEKENVIGERKLEEKLLSRLSLV